MKSLFGQGLVSCIALALAGSACGSQSPIEGVFGLSPIPDGAALAVWVPLGEGESVSGIAWYNNDADASYPQILAVAGDAETPEVVGDAVVVGEDVRGMSLDWSEYTFPQPLASETAGIYVVFRLPRGAGFSHEGQGGGSGIGYRHGAGPNRCWIALEDNVWSAVDEDYQMAVDVIANEAKSGGVLVLRRTTDQTEEHSTESLSTPLATLSCSVAPNPFNPSTEIEFTIVRECDVELSLFDVRGRRICCLASGLYSPGNHAVRWNGNDEAGQSQASGVYIVTLRAGLNKITRRLTLVR